MQSNDSFLFAGVVTYGSPKVIPFKILMACEPQAM